MICPCKSPYGAVDLCPHCRSPLGEWLISYADFNPNHNHVNAAPKQSSLQTTSRPHHHATPKQNYCTYINVLVSIPIYDIKIKKSGIGHQIFNKRHLVIFGEIKIKFYISKYLWDCPTIYHLTLMGEQLLLVTGRLFVSWRSSPLHFASADTVIHIVSSGQSTPDSIELLIEDQAFTRRSMIWLLPDPLRTPSCQ